MEQEKSGIGEGGETAARAFGFSLIDLHMHLSVAFHLMRGLTRPQAAALGLGPGQPRLLSYAAVHEGCTQREIAAYFSVDPSAISRMIDALVRAGYLELRAGEDRRRKTLHLTDEGADAIRVWDACCAEVDETMMRGFSDEERETLDRLLARVRGNLKDAVAGKEARDA